ncbi:hypothetical protein Drorol1_Dr00015304 [Drosera rotundifolia]
MASGWMLLQSQAGTPLGILLRVCQKLRLVNFVEGPHLADFDATDVERAVMSDLIMCDMGIPPLQGTHLMATGHHYLSAPGERSKQMFTVVEKQFWKKSPTKEWVKADKEDIQDVLWHKAGHPINMAIKYRIAVDPTVPVKLRTAMTDSAASRLPAKESILKAAETLRTLVVNVRPFFESYGGDTSYLLLRASGI